MRAPDRKPQLVVGVPAAGEAPAGRPPAARQGRRRLSAADHHVQDALELYAAGHLQYLAEQQGRAHGQPSDAQTGEAGNLLANNGHTWESLSASKRHSTYLANVGAACPVFLARLLEKYPGSTFSFRFVGTQGRLAQRKGDIELSICGPGGEKPEIRSISLKNYEKGLDRIQVCSGTFQSFVLGFVFEGAGVGSWRDPTDGSTRRVSHPDFRAWRDSALERNNYGWLRDEFAGLDALHKRMRETFFSQEHIYYDEAKAQAEQRSIGRAGAEILHRILSRLPEQVVRKRILKPTGFDGAEDLLAFGKGKIADTLTDPDFGELLRKVQQAAVDVSVRDQTIHVDFVLDGATVLAVAVPCTVNTNGAWFRDGEPYDGVRWHAKEKVLLAWGQRRPKKSREIATSTNTYVLLGRTGVLREISETGDGPG